MPKHSRQTLVEMLTHITYEIGMLAQLLVVARLEPVLQRGFEMPAKDLARLANNVAVEVRAIHLRNLAEFFLGNGGKDIVLAHEYIRGFKPQRQFRDTVFAMRDRASVQIAHLSTKRIDADKAWRNEDSFKLLDTSADFIEQLLETDWLDTSPNEREQLTSILTIARALRPAAKGKSSG